MLSETTCTTRSVGEHLALILISSVIARLAVCACRGNLMYEMVRYERTLQLYFFCHCEPPFFGGDTCTALRLLQCRWAIPRIETASLIKTILCHCEPPFFGG